MSDSLRPHGLQHASFPCQSPTPRDYSNSSIDSLMPSNHLIFSRPLLLTLSIFPSIRVFSSESVLRIWWQKYWSFSFSISPTNEYSELISFRIDWLDFLAVQGTLKGLLQHWSLKALILLHLVFFVVQLSHPYMTTGQTIALTIWSFVSKVMSLLFKLCLGLSVTQSYQTLCNPWTVASQAPLSMECSRQEYWSGMPFTSPGYLPDLPGLGFLHCRWIFYFLCHQETGYQGVMGFQCSKQFLNTCSMPILC